MAMLCYKNGSLTREEVRDRRCGGSWDEMGRVIGRSPPANNGYVGFFITQVRDAESTAALAHVANRGFPPCRWLTA